MSSREDLKAWVVLLFDSTVERPVSSKYVGTSGTITKATFGHLDRSSIRGNTMFVGPLNLSEELEY